MTIGQIDVVSAGCVFPSGPSIGLACVAMASQVALLRKHPYYVDRCGYPVRVSAFPEPASRFDVWRWWGLVKGALDDLACGGQESAGSRTAYWLLLPPKERPGQSPELATTLGALLREHHADCAAVTVLHGGHAEGVKGLVKAREWLEEHPENNAIVVAVDCPLVSETLYWLESQDLLHGSCSPYEGRVRRNPYGRIPGEGAAALRLRRVRRGPAWARLIGWASAEEQILYRDTRPCLGEGMSRAAQAALQQAVELMGLGHPATAGSPACIGKLYVDLNGEPYRADQFGFTYQRIRRWLKPGVVRRVPALVTGDLGCASLITHLALSARELHGGTSGDPDWHLILSSSDDVARGALVLTRPELEPYFER